MNTVQSPALRPMLAANVTDTATLRYPLTASPKLDGIRALILGGVVVSRSLKPIPNAHVQQLFGRPELEGLDGELIVGPATDPGVYRRSVSGVMSRDGQPDVRLHCFDHCAAGKGYRSRMVAVRRAIEAAGADRAVMVPRVPVADPSELEALAAEWIAQGYEGVMLRDPRARYKHGRSTVHEAALLKIKNFDDCEAVVVGTEALRANTNAARVNALGLSERSHASAGRVARDMLGALVCERDGIRFRVGSGFSDAERVALWADRADLIGRVAKVKHLSAGGYERPRHPVFIGWRDWRDCA